MKLLLSFLACLFASSLIAQEESNPRHTVSGVVRDAKGDPVVESVIVPFTESGSALSADKAIPLTMESAQSFGSEDFILFTKTDEDGAFSIDLPNGAYRIVAQSWLEREGPIVNLLEENGNHVRIDGVAGIVFDGEMEAAEPVVMEPIGSGTLEVSSQESSDMLLISIKPLACDPVLGFMALMGDFWSGLVAGTKMQKKEITISGLPAGEISVFSFVNDNNGGIGGNSTTLTDGQSAELYVGVFAGWSNGHRTPPEDLEELVKYITENKDEQEKIQSYVRKLQSEFAPKAENADRGEYFATMAKLLERLDEEYELADGTMTTLGEVWAASAYVRLARR